VLDEIFGEDNFCLSDRFSDNDRLRYKTIATLGDFILWYARDKQHVRVK